MTCTCTSLGNAGRMLNGLGQIDPASVAIMFSDAKHMWDDLQKMFGIGAGRREADIIVPLQNKVVSTVIAPISAYLEQVRNGQIEPTCSEVSSRLGEVKSSETQWLNYLHTTQWQDGRAATQAEATLAPYFAGEKNDLQALIQQTCSAGGAVGAIGDTIGQIFKTPTGETNWPVVAGVAGLAYMLIRRK